MRRKLNKNGILRLSLLIVLFFSIFFSLLLIDGEDNQNRINNTYNEETKVPVRNSAFIDNPSLRNITWGYSTTEYCQGIAMDDLGNIFITGYIYKTSGSYNDGFLVKYNNAGIQQWNITWGDGNTYDDYGWDVALDTFGNIYVTGSVHISIPEGRGLFAAKYNTAGVQQWNTTWTTGSGVDVGYDIAVNTTGDVYVAGKVGFTSEDAVLVKFNSTGDYQWNFTWGGSDNDYAEGIALDNSGNIYITGQTEEFDSNGDAFIAKFNGQGDSLMNITWGKSNNVHDEATSIVLDASDNIYITGQSRSFGPTGDVFIAKFNSTGIQQWNASWDGNVNTDQGNDIVLDSSGDIFITGWSYYVGAGSREVFVAKYNSSTGIQQWVSTWGGSSQDWGQDLVLDNSRHIYITGRTNSMGVGSYDAFIAKVLQYPLGDFELETNTTNPDIDGNFLLTWNESINADNYSIYRHSSFIHRIKGNGTLVANGIETLNHSINGYLSGDYYFIVYAYNDFLNRSSNCILVQVRIPPKDFILDTNTTLLDTDGTFWVNWSESIGADNYSLYWSTSPGVDTGDTLYIDGLTNDSILMSGFTSGTYYFRILSHNETGSTWSNELTIQVQLPTGSDNDDDDDDDDKDDDESWVTWLINFLIQNSFLIIFMSAVAVSVSFAYVYTNRAKKKTLDAKLIASAPINDSTANLVASDRLDEIFTGKNTLEKILGAKEIELTVLDEEFLEKVELFEWEGTEKILFIRDMLALTPDKRTKIMSDMLKTLNDEE